MTNDNPSPQPSRSREAARDRLAPTKRRADHAVGTECPRELSFAVFRKEIGRVVSGPARRANEEHPSYCCDSANATSVLPDAMTTCCRPSSMYVMAAAPQIDEPVG